jgi:hypothetical protein
MSSSNRDTNSHLLDYVKINWNKHTSNLDGVFLKL